MTNEAKECLTKAKLMLGEHFEAGQIIVTFYEEQSSDDKSTIYIAVGWGNYYARLGATECWLQTEQADVVEDSLSGSVDKVD